MSPDSIVQAVLCVSVVASVVVAFVALRPDRSAVHGPTDEAAWLKFYELTLASLAARGDGGDRVLIAARTTRTAAGFADSALEAYRERWPSSPVASPAASSPKTSTTPPGKRPSPLGPLPGMDRQVVAATQRATERRAEKAKPVDAAAANVATVDALLDGYDAETRAAITGDASTSGGPARRS